MNLQMIWLPELLEVCVANPLEYISRLDNAGSLFLGNYSPEPLGDYYAGPKSRFTNQRNCKIFPPLSVDSFVKNPASFLLHTRRPESRKDDIVALAEAEGLTAHANSIKVRSE